MVERGVKAAKSPAIKSLDFKVIPTLNKMVVLDLARREWIDHRETVIALGPDRLARGRRPNPRGALRVGGIEAPQARMSGSMNV